VAKFAGLWAVLAGATVGGIVMLKVSINRALWLFGFMCATGLRSRPWCRTPPVASAGR
jgi:PAT family beta-lactamase induction signal transducer AmpG